MSIDYKAYFGSESRVNIDQVTDEPLARYEAEGALISDQISPIYDDVFRVYLSGRLIASTDMVQFSNALEERVRKIANVSDEVISSLRAKLDFNGHYIAFLLNQLSEDEFSRISEQLAVRLNSNLSADLEEKVRILFFISRQSYSASDLSDYFKIEPHIAAAVLDRLKDKGLIDNEGNY